MVERRCAWTLVVLVLVGCSDADGAEQSSPFEPDVIHPDVFAALSEYQHDLLDDGALTFDEYQTAIQDTRSCALQAGVIFDEFELEDGIYTYAYGVGRDSEMTIGEAQTRFTECSREFSSSVETLWQTEFVETYRDG